MSTQTFVAAIRSNLSIVFQDVTSPIGEFDESAFQKFCGRVDSLVSAECDYWRRSKIIEMAKASFGYVESKAGRLAGAKWSSDNIEF